MKVNKQVKASITAEAALVCPIFLFAVLALINIITWFGEAEDVQRKLSDDIRTVQAAAYVSENVFPLQDEDGNIDLMNMYVAGINVPLPGLKKPIVRQHVVSRPFSGISVIGEGQSDEIVYITPKGAVYHLSPTCSYIKMVLYSAKLSEIDGRRNDSGAKYYPCDRCRKDGVQEKVYITSYGVRYHADKACTAIRRNVISVFKDEVENMRVCKKCAGE